MGEILRVRIKSLYGEVKGYLDSIDDSAGGPYTVPKTIVNKFNAIVDEVSQISNTDYSRSKIPESEIREDSSHRVVKPLMTAFVNRLELEYGFEKSIKNAPGIAIINDNSNKVTVQTNYTINNLIQSENDPEAKEKLEVLNNELNQKHKNWDTIKLVLIWIMNYSAELFLKILPTILEKYH